MKLIVNAVSIALLSSSAGLMWAQQATPQASPDGVVIRTETRQVLVDVVVTDKKGYVADLKEKDFKVYEDNREQPIKSFSWEADPSSPAHAQKHYLVLLYDQCHINFSDQAQARDAALKFVSANSGNNRPMSVVTFLGGMKTIQDFSEDTAKINQAVGSMTGPNLGTGTAVCKGDIAAQFFFGLEDLAKALSTIPGRKSLVVVSEGFPIGGVGHSEGVAAVNQLNKANVAVYPIDIRGVSTLGLGMPAPHAQLQPPPAGIQAFLQTVVYRPDLGMAFAPQRGGAAPAGGAPSGGGARGGSPAPAPAPAPSSGRGNAPAPAPSSGRGNAPAPSSGRGNAPAPGGGRGGAPTGAPARPAAPLTTVPQNLRLQNTLRNLNPAIPVTATDNQQVMYLLAQGTGGFVIADNDVLGAMLKISKEQDQYYLLGYTPPDPLDVGTCHTIKVKVEKSGLEVRSRSGYCNVKPQDLLTGTTAEQTLEAKATASQAGNIPATLQVPYFYTAHNVARVQVAMDITPAAIKFEKVKEKDKETGKEENKLHAEVNVLGIASTPQGAVAARFSDVVKLDFDNENEVKKFQSEPMHYENQFDVASGSYTLKVVFNSAGDQFGKLEAPLVVDPYDPKDFSLSGLAFSKESYPVAEAGLNLDAMLLEDKRPMIAGGLQFVPAGTNRFTKNNTRTAVYFEIYEPALENRTDETWVGLRMVVVDAATGEIKSDSGGIKLNLPPAGQGDMLARAYSVPLDKLSPGTYRVIVSAADNASKMAQRQVEFTLQ